MDDRWPNIFIELNQLIISIISLIRIGKYLLDFPFSWYKWNGSLQMEI
ncbi:hypothetical protein NQ315_010513 [Exocentrus adspersus]|uniref:Uncharacterized protein n=1 Tax=Exocentrus adspersus TaxID=1586481 RepID=A0AAV8VD35_9CUCU|nr:hypothetical protein NQ315_016740 [Exocentrus adspersus]KAJ8921605.1 hypothetical protein NQ315_010513 [Exocentrus adspersus]